MPILHVNIGSNRGDRRAHIERAVALIIESHPGCRVLTSDVVESEPWGYESVNGYLNVGVAIDLPVGPDGPEATALRELRAMQAIERQISTMPHRNPDGTYRDREIDIDLIEYGDLAMHTPALTLPHPRAAERAFVTEPLTQLKAMLQQ